MGLERSTLDACSGRSRKSTYLYVGGRLEVEDILTAVDSEYDMELGRFVVWFRGGVVVGCVCWRHTTMPYGA
jgi:hypothetical protein